MKRLIYTVIVLFIFIDFFAQLPDSYIRPSAYPNYYEVSLTQKKLSFSIEFNSSKASGYTKDQKSSSKNYSEKYDKGYLRLKPSNKELMSYAIQISGLTTKYLKSGDDWEIQTRIITDKNSVDVFKAFIWNYNKPVYYIWNSQESDYGFKMNKDFDSLLFNKSYSNPMNKESKTQDFIIRKINNNLYFFKDYRYVGQCEWREKLLDRFAWLGKDGNILYIDYLRFYTISRQPGTEFSKLNPEASYAWGNDKKKTIFFDDFTDNTNHWEQTVKKGFLEIGSEEIIRPVSIDKDVNFEIEVSELGDPVSRGISIPVVVIIQTSSGNAKNTQQLQFNFSESGVLELGTLTEKKDTPSKFTIRRVKNIYYLFYNEQFVYANALTADSLSNIKFEKPLNKKVLIDYIKISKFE